MHVHHCVTNIFTDLAKNFQIVFHMCNMLYLTEADKDTAMAAIGPQGMQPQPKGSWLLLYKLLEFNLY